jgi:hypothetical protein
MPVLGHDCDLIFVHPNVDGGAAYGFLLEPDVNSRYGPLLEVRRSLDRQTDGSLLDLVRLSFRVMLGDHLRNPDGSLHLPGRDLSYKKLSALLNQKSGLQLQTRVGLFLDLAVQDIYSHEQLYPALTLVGLDLYARNILFDPADSQAYLTSYWVDRENYGGERCWGNSFWRS